MDNEPVNRVQDNKGSGGRWFGMSTVYGVDKEYATPFMTRIWLGRLRLHVFHRPDQDSDCHDHPWDFWTFPLTSYVEEVVEEHFQTYNHGSGAIINPPIVTYERHANIVKAFWPHFRPAAHTHRVLGRWKGEFLYDWPGKKRGGDPIPFPEPGRIVTIVWRSHTKRKWGFLKNRDGRWCWLPWKEYVFNGGKHGPCE